MGFLLTHLQDTYVVEKVWIKNREDCCQNRINGVQVYVGDILCGTVTYDASKTSYEVLCNDGQGVIGDMVKIVNPATYLTLCEVKVWGPKDPIVADMLDEDEVQGERWVVGFLPQFSTRLILSAQIYYPLRPAAFWQ